MWNCQETLIKIPVQPFSHHTRGVALMVLRNWIELKILDNEYTDLLSMIHSYIRVSWKLSPSPLTLHRHCCRVMTFNWMPNACKEFPLRCQMEWVSFEFFDSFELMWFSFYYTAPPLSPFSLSSTPVTFVQERNSSTSSRNSFLCLYSLANSTLDSPLIAIFPLLLLLLLPSLTYSNTRCM